MSVGRFLGMIGAVLVHPSDGRYLVLKRSEEKDFGAGIWECVTGRVDQGEGFESALHREVKEELGVEVEIDYIAGTSHFYRGQPNPENEMIGIFYCCTIKGGQEIKTSWEHADHRWVTAEEIEGWLAEGYWLRELILRAELIRKHIHPEIVSNNRKYGYEIG